MAAVLEKPIHVLVSKDFDPGPRLSSMLDLLEFAIPQNRWQRDLNESAILSQIDTVVRDAEKARSRPSWLRNRIGRRQRCQAVYRKYQIAKGQNRALGDRSVLFLDGFGDGLEDRPRTDFVIELLEQEARMDKSEARLGRLWLAIRELLARPPGTSDSMEYLELWNRSLKRWCDVAGWSSSPETEHR